jgi:hypothetical protein
MYEEQDDEERREFVITGSDGFEVRIPKGTFGVVLRGNVEDPMDEVAQRYVMEVSQMTTAERIALALYCFAYPTL